MCGIFGFTLKDSAIEPERRAILAATLARLNDERGGDSWGVCRLESESPHVHRGLTTLADHVGVLLGSPRLFAHTRWATHGKVTIENAHPFAVNGIIGAHNGIVYNHYDLAKKYNRSYEVDSQHIFAHLSVGADMGEIEGYGAIEWVVVGKPEMYLCRLVEGELAIAGVGGDLDHPLGVVWSSDADHLEDAFAAAGLDWFPYQVRTGIVYEPRETGLFISGPKIEITKRKYVPIVKGAYSDDPNWQRYLRARYGEGTTRASSDSTATVESSRRPRKTKQTRRTTKWLRADEGAASDAIAEQITAERMQRIIDAKSPPVVTGDLVDVGGNRRL